MSEDCVICLEQIDEEKNDKKTLTCNHTFHSTCIDTWLQQKKECPICRLSFSSNNFPHSYNPVIEIQPRQTNIIMCCYNIIHIFLMMTSFSNFVLGITHEANVFIVLWCLTGLSVNKNILILSQITGTFLVFVTWIDYYNTRLLFNPFYTVQIIGLLTQLVLTYCILNPFVAYLHGLNGFR